MMHALAIDAAGAALTPAFGTRPADLGRIADLALLPHLYCWMTKQSDPDAQQVPPQLHLPSGQQNPQRRSVGLGGHGVTPQRPHDSQSQSFPVQSTVPGGQVHNADCTWHSLGPRGTHEKFFTVRGAIPGCSLQICRRITRGSHLGISAAQTLPHGPAVSRFDVRIDTLHAAPVRAFGTLAGPVDEQVAFP